MARITVDTSELDNYVAKLEGVPTEVLSAVEPAFNRTALEIKKAQQKNLRDSGNPGFKKIASAVHYDEISKSASSLETRVGIDKGSPGSLGNIAVYGTYKGGGTRDHPAMYADQQVPILAREAAKAAGDLL